MTESDWLACKDVNVMLRFLPRVVSERKLRLFVVACCRRVPRLLRSETYRGALGLAERFADGMASKTDLEETHNLLLSVGTQQRGQTEWKRIAELIIRNLACGCVRPHLTSHGAHDVGLTRGFTTVSRREENRLQRSLLKDICGNPFRRATIQHGWLTLTARDLATAAYEERSLPSGELECDRLCILADALEEAGCPDAAMLDHLRSAGPHVRGCWAVDLLTDRD